MTRDQANADVEWFHDLYRNATVVQLQTLRDGILKYESDDFRAAAKAALMITPYANDAITKICERLGREELARQAPASTQAQRTDAMRAEYRRQGEKAAFERAADDALIDGCPLDLLDRLKLSVLDGLDARMGQPGVAAFLSSRPFTKCPAWRGLVADALRAQAGSAVHS